MTIVRKPDQQKVMPYLKRTESTRLQQRTELECQPFFVDIASLTRNQQDHLRETGLLQDSKDKHDLDICLLYERHVEYLSKAFQPSLRPQLRPSFVSLDSSRSWMMYWTLHPCDLLQYVPTNKESQSMVLTLRSFYHKDGGFGGGPGQLPHAATTYAAILSLAILAGHQSQADDANKSALSLLRSIRTPLYHWILSLEDKVISGAVRMHHDGEIDVRATYCAVAVLSLLQLPLPKHWAAQVAKCQTWEGGFGGEPGAEAHGGYTYCALAALQLLQQTQLVDVLAIADYISRRQLSLEGGFSGRSNKLVDGCYSFWQGGGLAIASELLQGNNDNGSSTAQSGLFDAPMLERYILLCAQDVHGGLRDKPSKNRDFYHSCYNLSGFSIAQHYGSISANDDDDEVYSHKAVIGRTHTCYNIRVEHADFLRQQFESLKDMIEETASPSSV